MNKLKLWDDYSEVIKPATDIVEPPFIFIMKSEYYSVDKAISFYLCQ